MYGGIGAPLREPVFRRIWSASLLSNLGQQMQAVAAAWAMLEITHRADLVALVQTASMLPVMLLALPAGALADMYDRRKVAIAALFLSLCGASMLAVFAFAGVVSPNLILIGVFVTGTGISLYSPAWQASVAEIVGGRALPAAISLYSMSNNAARSVGPAIGGFVIAATGILAAFTINAALYLPILFALAFWKRVATPPRLPPERLDKAMLGGLRYVRHSPQSRKVVMRAFFTAAGGAAIYAMLPVVANQLLGGGARVYGILLGGFGLGAVGLATFSSQIQGRHSPERIAVVCSLILSAALIVVSMSAHIALTFGAMIAAGGAWMVSISTYNVSVQLASPRWVSGRTLAAFQAAVAAGLAGGAALWGHIAERGGVSMTLLFAGGYFAVTALFGRFLGLQKPIVPEQGPPPGRDPVVQMALTGRSGPLVIEIEYRVRNEDARAFYYAMRAVRRSRERNGAYAMSLMRDIADPQLWVEKISYPTWNDYMRARDRPTSDDRAHRDRAIAFHIGDELPLIRRFLERPTGSVRWSEDTIDPGETLPAPASFGPMSSP
ncbi:MAG: MFS transporter [Rhodobiaceae bacterium]|nr:MFS transporter [Rhodobiaceae bacterium]